MIRVLFWNCGGGPSDRKTHWLLAQEWDVAIVVECSKRGSTRLQGYAEEHGWELSCSALEVPPHGRGRRYGVTLLLREPISLETVLTPPSLSGRFRERVWGARVAAPLGAITVAGFHAPHGGGGQAEKEEAYRLVTEWLSATPGPVVFGMDSNTWTDGVFAATEVHADPDFLHQSSFQIPGRVHGLHDAFVEAAESNAVLRDEESWWTYSTGARRYRWDQIWIDASLAALDAQVHEDAPDVAPGKAHRPLSVLFRRK